LGGVSLQHQNAIERCHQILNTKVLDGCVWLVLGWR